VFATWYAYLIQRHASNIVVLTLDYHKSYT